MMIMKERQCYFCDANVAAVVATADNNGKWKLYRIKILGMGHGEHGELLAPDEFDDVVPYNTCTGVSYIAVRKDGKWELIQLVSGKEPFELENFTFERFKITSEKIKDIPDIQKLIMGSIMIESFQKLKTVGSKQEAKSLFIKHLEENSNIKTDFDGQSDIINVCLKWETDIDDDVYLDCQPADFKKMYSIEFIYDKQEYFDVLSKVFLNNEKQIVNYIVHIIDVGNFLCRFKESYGLCK
jgi:hypothetical protein